MQFYELFDPFGLSALFVTQAEFAAHMHRNNYDQSNAPTARCSFSLTHTRSKVSGGVVEMRQL